MPKKPKEGVKLSKESPWKRVLGPEWEKELSFNEIWGILGSKYTGKKKFSKKDVEAYARAMVEAAEHILEKKPNVIIAPLRGAFPLWRGISFALSELKKKRYEEELKKLEERTDLTEEEKKKEKERLKREILDYHPRVLTPPNTGKLRSMIVNYIKLHKGLSDLLKRIENEEELSRTKLMELAKEQPKLYHLVTNLFNKVISGRDVLDKDGIARLAHQLKRVQELTTPDFSRVMLLDEVSGGGAISKNYEFLKRALKKNNSKIHVLGIAETDRLGRYKIRRDAEYLLEDENVTLIPVRKLVTMDNIRLVGLTYISKTKRGVGHYGIDRGAKLTTDVAPTPPSYFAQHKWFMRLINAKIKELVRKKRREEDELERFLPPTLRWE